MKLTFRELIFRKIYRVLSRHYEICNINVQHFQGRHCCQKTKKCGPLHNVAKSLSFQNSKKCINVRIPSELTTNEIRITDLCIWWITFKGLRHEIQVAKSTKLTLSTTSAGKPCHNRCGSSIDPNKNCFEPGRRTWLPGLRAGARICMDLCGFIWILDI